MRTLPALLLLALSPAIANARVGQAADLGKIDFPTSGSPTAQEHFLEGVLFLHSFEYNDARAAFRRARETEPDFAMAAWGEAMTHNYPIWLRESREEGRAALERLAPTAAERLDKAPTEREKGYLTAVEMLFGEGDKLTRDLAYRDAMAKLARRFPDDLDAAAFHSLAILGTCHQGRDTAAYMRAAAVAEEVFDKNPEHPGAAHYLIHSYDDPVHAPLGIRPARVYAGIAPAATHALHMPSHIFLALGLWDETAASNEDSWQASLAAVERDGLGIDRKSFHALLWLEYAYLQQGRYTDARRLLAIMEADVQASGSQHTRNHLAYMKAHYRLETQRWGENIAEVDLEGLGLNPAATALFARGVTALRLGEVEIAQQQLSELRKRRQDEIAQAVEGGTAEGYAPSSEIRTLEAQIMELALEAQIALGRDETERALELLAKAAELEDASSFGFGPPVPVKPSLELYGEVLLDLGHHAEAKAQLEKALARAPRRVKALQALELASRGLGLTEEADKVRETLELILHRADARTETAVAYQSK